MLVSNASSMDEETPSGVDGTPSAGGRAGLGEQPVVRVGSQDAFEGVRRVGKGV